MDVHDALDKADMIASGGKPYGDTAFRVIATLAAEVRRVQAMADKDDRAHEQTCKERDAAEDTLSQAFFLITGRSPEWSNHFGHAEALAEIDDAQRTLREAARERGHMSQEEHNGRANDRGFREYAALVDSYGSRVRVVESSSAEHRHVWIFSEKDGKDGVFHLGEWQSYSPHLNVAQAIKLRDALTRFIGGKE